MAHKRIIVFPLDAGITIAEPRWSWHVETNAELGEDAILCAQGDVERIYPDRASAVRGAREEHPRMEMELIGAGA